MFFLSIRVMVKVELGLEFGLIKGSALRLGLSLKGVATQNLQQDLFTAGSTGMMQTMFSYRGAGDVFPP